MTLLYLAVAYMAGIYLGSVAWEAGWLGCDTPTWLWLACLVLLPFSPLLNRWQRTSDVEQQMRWPVSAGFVPPRPFLTPALITALGLCASMGLLRYAAQPVTPCWKLTDLAYYNLPAERAFDRTAPQVTITGYISEYPAIDDTRQRFNVTAEQLIKNGVAQPVRGVVQVNTTLHTRYEYGQPVQLSGRLVTPADFADFSYREYLARQGVHSVLYEAQIETEPDSRLRGSWLRGHLYRVRAQGEALLKRMLPEPYASLANGILLGIGSDIPDDLYEQFNRTGTSHVLVISGSNVSLIAALMLALSQRIVGRKRAIYPALAGILCFTLLVGADASVLRAGLMGGLVVIAFGLDRRSTAVVSLAAACWWMTLLNPLTLWDVGFQLSSAATAGLILFSAPLASALSRLWPGLQGSFLRTSKEGSIDPVQTGASESTATASSISSLAITSRIILYGLIVDGLVVTIAASIFTLPLIGYYFERISTVALLANLLIVPVQPWILLCGTAGLLLGLIGLSWLAQAVLWVPWLGLWWTVFLVKWFAAMPGASWSVADIDERFWLLLYALILAVHWRAYLLQWAGDVWQWIQGKWQARVLQPAALLFLVMMNVLVWRAVVWQPDGRLHLYFLDIGQGDGILIQTPSGNQVLIDGGSSPQRLFGQLGAVMPFWDRSLDLVILTHADADHMNAQVEAPQRLTVAQVLTTQQTEANPESGLWQRRLGEAAIPVSLLHAGGWIDLGDGVALWVLWPPAEHLQVENGANSDNENSLVLKLVYDKFSVLLTGDAGLPSEVMWLQSGLPLSATVLKVGHHGSESSTSPSFVNAVNPLMAVIQVGAENRYGHPTEETLATLAGRTLLRNDLHGRIHIATDGTQVWLETDR